MLVACVIVCVCVWVCFLFVCMHVCVFVFVFVNVFVCICVCMCSNFGVCLFVLVPCSTLRGNGFPEANPQGMKYEF
jgi:hypothetical protein